eukprot:scaffold236084_cov36-Prasinocladus_malaysianus.AAC.1
MRTYVSYDAALPVCMCRDYSVTIVPFDFFEGQHSVIITLDLSTLDVLRVILISHIHQSQPTSVPPSLSLGPTS